jgi:hypothetical protein
VFLAGQVFCRTTIAPIPTTKRGVHEADFDFASLFGLLCMIKVRVGVYVNNDAVNSDETAWFHDAAIF